MSGKHINWEHKYELGIEDIDYQHHYFLNLINRLSDELESTTDNAYRTALIAELNAYARFHFKSEENMMMRAGFPELAQHKEHHRDLIDKLSYQESMLALNKLDKDDGEIIDFLVQWFLKHTAVEDRRFADFLHAREISG